MSVQDTLTHLLEGLYITSLLSYDEFADAIRSEEGHADISTEMLQAYYDSYRNEEVLSKEKSKEQVAQFTKYLRENSIKDIVSGEQNNFYSLEDIIDSLYKVSLLLETRTNVVNDTLKDKINTMKRFEEATKYTVPSDDSMKDIIHLLGTYRILLQELDS